MIGRTPVSGSACTRRCFTSYASTIRSNGNAPASTRPAFLPPLGGDHTGPNPTDRGKLGCKHHVIVDQRGLPLAAQLSAANVHDSRLLQPLVRALPEVSGLTGRPRKRPTKLHADKGYDYRCHRKWLRLKGIAPRIARRGIESKEHLGRWRWVVERTLGWLHRFRRLRIRYERRADIHQGFLSLACAIVCLRFVDRYC